LSKYVISPSISGKFCGSEEHCKYTTLKFASSAKLYAQKTHILKYVTNFTVGRMKIIYFHFIILYLSYAANSVRRGVTTCRISSATT